MSSSGKGQSLVRNAGELERAWHYGCEGSRGDIRELIIEEFIRFDSEITLLTVTQKDGPTLFCPPIGHVQKGGEAGNTRFFGKILPNGVEIFSKTEGSTFYFQSPLPYLCTCTITVDAKRKDHVEERKSERQMKIETSRKFLDCTIITYSFLRNGYNYCLANVFRKMEIAYKNGTSIRST